MKKIEDYKEYGYDFIGNISIYLDTNNHIAIIKKTIEMFDCNGVLEGSITQELAEFIHADNTVQYQIIGNILEGGMTNVLGMELLGTSVYELNEYVYI